MRVYPINNESKLTINRKLTLTAQTFAATGHYGWLTVSPLQQLHDSLLKDQSTKKINKMCTVVLR